MLTHFYKTKTCFYETILFTIFGSRVPTKTKHIENKCRLMLISSTFKNTVLFINILSTKKSVTSYLTMEVVFTSVATRVTFNDLHPLPKTMFTTQMQIRRISQTASVRHQTYISPSPLYGYVPTHNVEDLFNEFQSSSYWHELLITESSK